MPQRNAYEMNPLFTIPYGIQRYINIMLTSYEYATASAPRH